MIEPPFKKILSKDSFNSDLQCIQCLKRQLENSFLCVQCHKQQVKSKQSILSALQLEVQQTGKKTDDHKKILIFQNYSSKKQKYFTTLIAQKRFQLEQLIKKFKPVQQKLKELKKIQCQTINEKIMLNNSLKEQKSKYFTLKDKKKKKLQKKEKVFKKHFRSLCNICHFEKTYLSEELKFRSLLFATYCYLKDIWVPYHVTKGRDSIWIADQKEILEHQNNIVELNPQFIVYLFANHLYTTNRHWDNIFDLDFIGNYKEYFDETVLTADMIMSNKMLSLKIENNKIQDCVIYMIEDEQGNQSEKHESLSDQFESI